MYTFYHILYKYCMFIMWKSWFLGVLFYVFPYDVHIWTLHMMLVYDVHMWFHLKSYTVSHWDDFRRSTTSVMTNLSTSYLSSYPTQRGEYHTKNFLGIEQSRLHKSHPHVCTPNAADEISFQHSAADKKTWFWQNNQRPLRSSSPHRIFRIVWKISA